MASYITIFFSLSLLLLLALTPAKSQQQHRRFDQVQRYLLAYDYSQMSKALASMLHSGLLPDFKSLYQENKTYTIFAPDDDTFRSLPEAVRQLSLLLYQIIPLEVEMGLLQSSAMPEHKLETLLEGHPLAVTTGLPDSFTHLPSLNLVTVVQWDVYNDGKLIVHGMVDFFNPDFQTTHYPWCNGPEAHMVSPTAATDNIKGSSSESMFSSAVLLNYDCLHFVPFLLVFRQL